jgi:hypothetical protein
LEKLKSYLDPNSNILSEPGKIQIQMVEGEGVFNEAIEYLNSLSGLMPLEWDDNLTKSATEHVLDIGQKGLLSYESSDGTEPEERISKYGHYLESLGENIDFGPNDALGVIVSLTLDDGETDRPHRENIFKSDYRKVGIACGPHKTEYQMCVMDFAYDFLSKDCKKPVERKNIVDIIKPEPRYEETFGRQNNRNGLDQSPLVRISIDREDDKKEELEESLIHQVKHLNLEKRVISKFTEITTKIVYTYHDGSTKEVIEKQNHTFNY